jgi:hypothetical protein
MVKHKMWLVEILQFGMARVKPNPEVQLTRKAK